MGRYKCAYECESSDEADEKYFKFPLFNERRLKKWLSNMKWKDWTPSRFSVLCSKHFEEQYLDRSGKCVQLREDAVPTIFPLQEEAKKMQAPETPKSTRRKQVGTKSTNVSMTTTDTVIRSNPDDHLSCEDPELSEPAEDQRKPSRWRIIMDEGLMKINSFPHFFHGDYCASQDVQWAPDTDVMTSTNEMACQDPEKVIQVSEAWQWLNLDVRGPLPPTRTGHTHVVTLSDCYSKWVEAAPVPAFLPAHVAMHVADAVAHFGYPLRVLSRLPRYVIRQINQELATQLTAATPLVLYHPHAGVADVSTQQMIDRMVSELVQEHAADWDVYLPAKVFALCFQEHSATKQRPFALLCCDGPEPVSTPRGLPYTDTEIRESTLVVA
ncbi:uncharacterized protein zgc:153292 isoform X1 [Entelurus aequoreus]|uniref:uncharacterized protein zgc:153292 isoform X1 n=2 Tax=Entelurus aequoreus TaxID=161455 RepID=UPI002B1CFD0C|nr:uncharacterized protein zgc:153292 isoform X1 [Entelurus aequoreus]